MEVLERSLTSRPVDPPLSAHLQQRIAKDFTPRMDALGGRFLLHGKTAGPNAVRLDGNDYLGITGHPAILAAQVAALRKDNEFVIQSAHSFMESIQRMRWNSPLPNGWERRTGLFVSRDTPRIQG